jgi:hypothetical protein
VRFLLFLSIVCSLFSASIFHATVTSPPQCAPLLPPAPAVPLVQPSAKAGTLLINEVLPLSKRTWDCSEVGTSKEKHNMWIELYNSQNQAFDLSAVHTHFDTGAGTNRAYVLTGSAIAAHGFFVFFPEIDGFFSQTKTSLVRLLFNGSVIDQVLVPPALGYEQSYARIPDGGKDWRITSTPTINASNTSPVLTPTPTRSHATATKTVIYKYPPTTASSGTTGSSAGGGAAGTTQATAENPDGQPTPSDGVQPAWNGLQVPSSPGASSAVATAPTDLAPDTTSAAPVADNSADVPRKVLFSSFAVVAAGVLFLCWRRFKPT